MPRLRRTFPDQPGWTRRRAGKGFTYLDEHAPEADRLRGLLATGLLAASVFHYGQFRIAEAKAALPFFQALMRGVLGNVLVCLAVWLCMAARSVTDKILAIVFPISAFVACGFEHSVANMFFLPLGVALTLSGGDPIAGTSVLVNLAVVTIGNVIGGTGLVALVYWFVYLRHSTRPLSRVSLS